MIYVRAKQKSVSNENRTQRMTIEQFDFVLRYNYAGFDSQCYVV